MLEEALKKLQAEIVASPKKAYLPVIGGFMMDRIRKHPAEAEKVMVEGKTLAGALNEMKKEAKKYQEDGCGVLTNEQGLPIVLKYYGVAVPEAAPAPSAAPGISVTFDDLF